LTLADVDLGEDAQGQEVQGAVASIGPVAKTSGQETSAASHIRLPYDEQAVFKFEKELVKDLYDVFSSTVPPHRPSIAVIIIIIITICGSSIEDGTGIFIFVKLNLCSNSCVNAASCASQLLVALPNSYTLKNTVPIFIKIFALPSWFILLSYVYHSFVHGSSTISLSRSLMKARLFIPKAQLRKNTRAFRTLSPTMTALVNKPDTRVARRSPAAVDDDAVIEGKEGWVVVAVPLDHGG